MTSAFGLSVSVKKMKFMAVGHGVMEDRRLALDENKIDWVSEFPYLGSLVTDDGRIHT